MSLPALSAKHAVTHRSGEPGLNASVRKMGTGLILQTQTGMDSLRSKYEHMPIVDFIRDVLGIVLWDKQIEIAESVDENFATAVKSCHGAGKSYLMAAIVIAFLHTRWPSIAVTTAPTNRQVRGILWRNLRAHHARSIGPLAGGKPLQVEYNLGEDHFAVGFKGEDENSDAAQGYHSPHLLAVVDEAAGVAEAVIASMDNIVTGADSRLVYIGNPTSMTGRFRRAFHEDAHLYNTISIAAEETPNIINQRIVIPGLVDQQWVDRQIESYGIDSPWVQSRVFARFPKQGEDSLVNLSDIEWSQEAGYEELDTTEDSAVRMGIDVARSGRDESAFCVRHGDVIIHESAVKGNDTMAVTARAEEIIHNMARRLGIDPHRDIRVRVDVIGLGAGVADRLRELGYAVVDVNVSRASSDRENWPKLRDELWWNLGERYRSHRVGTDHGLAIDAVTISQLVGIKTKYVSGYAKPTIESKEDYAKRAGGGSPDRAEAQMLTFAEDWQVEEPSEVRPSSFRLSGASGWTARLPKRDR